MTAAQMREADRRCIEELGIPGAVLMNAAGQAVFREIPGGPVGVVCGKGNNGGDGYVAARLALLAGYDTRVVLAADRASITGDAEVFLAAYERLGGRVVRAETGEKAGEAVQSLEDCEVVVDALLGTGVRGEVRGVAKAAIEAWPDVHTIAVDLPSGLDADTGEPCGCAVRADVTVTLQFPKIGLLADAAQGFAGRLVVADIGIPDVCADEAAWAALEREMDSPPGIAEMNSSPVETQSPTAINVHVGDDTLSVELRDGRSISVPIAWYPRLSHGTAGERSHSRLIANGRGIHWPDLDEDIGVENLLAGKPSTESQTSFKKWLERRKKNEVDT